MRQILRQARRASKAMATLREPDELLSRFQVALDELPLFRQAEVVAPLVEGMSLDELFEGVVRRAELAAASGDAEASVDARRRVTPAAAPRERRRRIPAETSLEIRDRDQGDEAWRSARSRPAPGEVRRSSAADDPGAPALLLAGGGTPAAARHASWPVAPSARAMPRVGGAAAEAAGAAAEAAGVREEAGAPRPDTGRAGSAGVPGPAGTRGRPTTGRPADATPAPVFGGRVLEAFAARFRDPILMAAFHTPLTPPAAEGEAAPAAPVAGEPEVPSWSHAPTRLPNTDEARLASAVERAEPAARAGESFAARFRDRVLTAAFHTPLTRSAAEAEAAGAASGSGEPEIGPRRHPATRSPNADDARLASAVGRAEQAARARAAPTTAAESAYTLAVPTPEVEVAPVLAHAALPPAVEGHSGLRRLASLATHVERPGAPLPAGPPRDVEDDLATRLADLLRAEARRHGVDTEGLVR